MGLRSLMFSFEGRINRAKYWLAGLIYLIGAMLYLTASIYALAGSLRGVFRGVFRRGGFRIEREHLGDRHLGGAFL